MSTCQQIIEGTLRKLGILAAGRSASQRDLDDVLEILKNSYRALITQGAFGTMRDITLFSGEYIATPGDHIFRQGSADIILPELIQNDTVTSILIDYQNVVSDYTIPTGSDTLMVSPPDCSVVRISDANTNNTIDWIYDGQTKNWYMLHELNIGDTAPLSFRDAEGLKCWLATIISEEYGVDVGPITLSYAAQFTYNLSVRVNSRRPSMPRDYF